MLVDVDLSHATLISILAVLAVLLLRLQSHVRRTRSRKPQPSSHALRTPLAHTKLRLLDLPPALLTEILDLVALEMEGHLASVLLTCRTLSRQGKAALEQAPLCVTAAKLQRAREAGQEGQILSWLSDSAQARRHLVLEAASSADLQQLVQTLAASGGSSLRRLELRFGETAADEEDGNDYDDASDGDEFEEAVVPCFRLPRDLGRLVCLTELCICQASVNATGWVPAPDLAQLSTLTALQTLALRGDLQGQVPAEALSILTQLTSLELIVERWDWGAGEEQREVVLGSEQLAALTALRRLALGGVPSLSEQQALAAWQHLEELELTFGKNGSESLGLWHALPQLPSLTRLAANCVDREAARVLDGIVPVCTRLVSLQLYQYPVGALPPLPPSLRDLAAGNSRSCPVWETLPMATSLRSLSFHSRERFPMWPDSTPAIFSHLTALCLRHCQMGKFPAPLTLLPAVEALDLSYSSLDDFPKELACVGSLRRLVLTGNHLGRVPRVLGGGAASRLKHQDLNLNLPFVVDRAGLAVLRSLTALTHLDLLAGIGRGLKPGAADSEVLREALRVLFR